MPICNVSFRIMNYSPSASHARRDPRANKVAQDLFTIIYFSWKEKQSKWWKCIDDVIK